MTSNRLRTISKHLSGPSQQETQSTKMSGPPIPFSQLPLDKSNPDLKLNAWGLYGKDDELGFLNRLTAEITASAASSEIKTGQSVPLDHVMDLLQDKPMFSRQAFVKNVYQKKPRIVHDDVWTLNTQSSTQWDGLRHFGYQKAQRFYNDVTVEDVAGTSDRGKANPNVLGIHNLVKRGGIQGRGILVDFKRWVDHGPGREVVGGEDGFHNFKSTGIKCEWLQQTLKWQNTVPRYGDILIIRSGFFPALQSLPEEEQAKIVSSQPPSLAGVEQSVEVLEWIWNHFSAVAADHPSFERWPPTPELIMHEVLLAGWGCNIGELFELEALSKKCQELNRWSFFFSSVPVNVPGGVASPPNAVAIF